MKKITVFLVMSMAVYAYAANVPVHMEQGGKQQSVRSGGTVRVYTGGKLQVDSGATMTISNTPTIAAISVTGASNLAGQVTMGAAGHVSTMTGTTGDWDIHGSMAHTGAVTMSSTLEVTGIATLNGGVTIGGTIALTAKTIAGLMAMTPTAVGQLYTCSNCTPVEVAMSTAATGVGAYGTFTGGQLD